MDSPRDVPTYDHKPEMSARAAAAEPSSSAGRHGDYGFGIINFANPDMVGHTGVIEAAVKAIETVDECLGQVVEAVHAKGGGVHRDRRPRQRRPHARARRQPEHRALAQPGADRGDRRRGRAARRRHPRRRGAHGAGAARRRSPQGDDRKKLDKRATEVLYCAPVSLHPTSRRYCHESPDQARAVLP